jgi:hypothetical protein
MEVSAKSLNDSMTSSSSRKVSFSVSSPDPAGVTGKLLKTPFPGNHFSPRPGRCIEIAEVVPRFQRSAAKRTFHYRRKRGANISTDEKLPMSFFILRHHEVDFPSVSENACFTFSRSVL